MIIVFEKKMEFEINVDEVAADIAFDLDEIMDNYLLTQVDQSELEEIQESISAKDYESLISTIIQRALDYYCGKIAKS